jgi:low temperature requirement protein LtrA
MSHGTADDIHWGEEDDERAEPVQRVSTLELFFDLVFVFTLTQLTELLAHELTVAGFARVLLIFGVSWWMYGGYAWLTNHLAVDQPARRLLLLVGMSAFLVQALALPHAFGEAGVAFGLAYLAVVLVHAALFWQATRAIGRTALFNVGSALLVIIAGFVQGGVFDWMLWTLALAVQVATPYLAHMENFRIKPAHLVERHGLLMIVALGESVVSIGIGAAGLPVDGGW